jgi:hypothetical protein
LLFFAKPVIFKQRKIAKKSPTSPGLVSPEEFPHYSYIDLPFLKRDNPYKNESQFLKRGNNSNIKLSILYLCREKLGNKNWFVW